MVWDAIITRTSSNNLCIFYIQIMFRQKNCLFFKYFWRRLIVFFVVHVLIYQWIAPHAFVTLLKEEHIIIIRYNFRIIASATIHDVLKNVFFSDAAGVLSTVNITFTQPISLIKLIFLLCNVERKSEHVIFPNIRHQFNVIVLQMMIFGVFRNILSAN